MNEESLSYLVHAADRVLAALEKTDRILTKKFAETDRILTEKFAETREQMKETDRQMKETDRQMKETDRQMKETDRQMKKTDRQIKKNARQMGDTDRRMKELQKTIGGWSNSHGSFAEEYFYNSFEEGKQNFFGEKFDEIKKSVKGLKIGAQDEYDIVLLNGKSISIIEVKFKAKKEHLLKLFRKVNTFRENFPDYKNHRVYLAFASLVFCEVLEQECIEHGIAVIKQVGDMVVVNDRHLKVF